jgi:signal transduction histidine kinase
MKSFGLKLILTFYIIGSIMIIAMGSSIIHITKSNNELIIKVMVLALMLLAIICILLAVFTVKKIIEPMSRMLKSGNTYDEIDDIQVEDYDPENLIKELKDKLNEARRNQRQSDTLLTRMTDGVISFDMKGKVTYINPAAATMLELKDSDNTFNKIFYRYKDINMEKIIYLENWTSSERKIENNQGS